MQKRVARNGERNQFLTQLTLACKRYLAHKTARGLAHGRRHLAKTLKVMLAHQARRRALHSAHVQGHAMPPAIVSRQQGLGLSRGDAVRIGAGAGIEARGEAGRGMIDLVKRDVRGKQRRHGPHPALSQNLKLALIGRKAHVLGYGMNPGVGTARARQLHVAAQKDLQGTTDLARHGQLSGLLGIPAKARAVIAHAQHDGSIQNLALGVLGNGCLRHINSSKAQAMPPVWAFAFWTRILQGWPRAWASHAPARGAARVTARSPRR